MSLVNSLMNLFGAEDSSSTTEAQNLFTPDQTALFKRLMGGESEGQQNLSDLYNILGDNELADRAFQTGTVDPAMRQFNEQIIPGMNREFQRGMFSSGRQNRMRDVTSNFGRGLVEARMQDMGRRQALQSQIATQQQNLLAQILGLPQQENITTTDQGSPGLLPSLLTGGAAITGGYLAGR